MCLLITIVNLLWLPENVIIGGSALALVSSLYLALERNLARSGFKELAISIGFGIGIFLYPFSLVVIAWTDILILLQMILLALANLLLIALIEAETDFHDGFHSLVTKIGPDTSKKVIISLCVLSLAASIIMYFGGHFIILQVFYSLSSLVLLLLLFNKDLFERNDYYRMISDGIFFIPLLLL